MDILNFGNVFDFQILTVSNLVYCYFQIEEDQNNISPHGTHKCDRSIKKGLHILNYGLMQFWLITYIHNARLTYILFLLQYLLNFYFEGVESQVNQEKQEEKKKKNEIHS